MAPAHCRMEFSVGTGKEWPEDLAERAAHAFVGETFYAKGAWRIVALDAVTFAKVVARQSDLPLEDAIEFQVYQSMRTGAAAPMMFVTRDRHFPEGVHPTHVAREFAWL